MKVIKEKIIKEDRFDTYYELTLDNGELLLCKLSFGYVHSFNEHGALTDEQFNAIEEYFKAKIKQRETERQNEIFNQIKKMKERADKKEEMAKKSLGQKIGAILTGKYPW